MKVPSVLFLFFKEKNGGCLSGFPFALVSMNLITLALPQYRMRKGIANAAPPGRLTGDYTQPSLSSSCISSSQLPAVQVAPLAARTEAEELPLETPAVSAPARLPVIMSRG